MSPVIGRASTKYNISREAIIIIEINKNGYLTDESCQTLGCKNITVENLTPTDGSSSDTKAKIASELYEIFSKYSANSSEKSMPI